MYKTLIILLALIGAAPAQTGGSVIRGLVYEKGSQEPLIGANVTVVGTTYGAAADMNGQFIIEDLPPGTYAVRASVIGYKPVTISDVVVNPIRPQRLEFELEQQAIEVDAVTVRPDYFSEVADKPVSTRTQSNEEIRRLPGGFEDVVRAISILPGVAQVTAGRNDLIVRGGAPSENLFVVDGLEVPNINHFGTQGATGGPQSFINLDYIDKTAFSSGGFGVRYGDKLSSVLNITLKEGREDRIGGKSTISATQFGLNLEGPLMGRGSFLFSARRSYLDFVFKAAGFGFVPEYWDFLAKANYRLGARDQLSVLTVAALNRVRFFNDTAEKRYDNAQILGSSQDQAFGGVTWRRILKSGLFTLTLGQIWFDFSQLQSDTLSRPIFDNESIEGETSLTASLIYTLDGGTELTTGASQKWIRFDSDILIPGFVDEFGYELQVSGRTRYSSTKTAAWAQLSQDISRINLTFGLRYDRFSKLDPQYALSPRMSMRYQLTNLTALTAAAGRYTQSPSYIWLSTGSNPEPLKTIKVNQYVAGVEHLLRDDTRVSLEFYLKTYADYPVSLTRRYLVMANTGAGFGGSREGFTSFGLDPLVSAGSGRARGAELFIQKKLSSVPCYGTASLSYSHSDFTALDGIRRPSRFDQRWILNLGGGYIFNEKWEISTRFRFATGRPYTPYEADYSRSIENYNSSRLRSNHFLDLRLDRRWILKNLALITYIDIQNIYNRPQYGVPVFNEFKGEIEQTQSIGILPSVGISAEF